MSGPGDQPWEVYVVKADADTLARQSGSQCCPPAGADRPEDGTAQAVAVNAPAGSGCC